MTQPYSNYKEARNAKVNDLYSKALKYYIGKLDELIENNVMDVSKPEVSVQLTVTWTPTSFIEYDVGTALVEHYKNHGYYAKYNTDTGQVIITF